MTELTVAGVAWAMRHADESQVARVALLVYAGGANDWPEDFKRTAVRLANESGKAGQS